MTLRFPRAFAAPALALAALTVGGCAYDGYYGGGVGYGGGYYDNAGYGYGGYGYGPSSYGYGYGWFDDYWYPGSGVFIYDRAGRRHDWRDSDRAHWEGGQGGRAGRGGPPPRGWSGGRDWQGPRGQAGGNGPDRGASNAQAAQAAPAARQGFRGAPPQPTPGNGRARGRQH